MKFKEYLEKVIKEKREQYAALEERAEKSDSLEEVRSIGETLKALKTEIDEAEKQLAEVKADEEEEKDPEDEPAADPAEERSFNPLATFNVRGAADQKAAEKRAQEFADSGKMTIAGSEARAVLVSSGQIATPKGVGGINDHMNIVSSIVDQTDVEDLTGLGSYEVSYAVPGMAADMNTEGEEANESDPGFRIAAVNPFTVDVITYVSKKIKKLSPLRYEEKVKQLALNALRAKVGKLIISGNGTTQPYGIINAKNTDGEAICKVVEMATGAIDETTLRKIVFAYGGDENVGPNAVLYLNKKDLTAFGDVRGTNEKAAVYEITPDGSNPNKGMIRDGGLSVPYVINSECKPLATAAGNDLTMVYGDPMNYITGLFGDYEITVSEDFRFSKKQIAIMGEVEVGGNLQAHEGFIVVKATA